MKGYLMTSLTARAEEFMQDVKLICQKNSSTIFGEKFIVTIKKSEIVAWSFDCLTCDHVNCPLYSSKPFSTVTFASNEL